MSSEGIYMYHIISDTERLSSKVLRFEENRYIHSKSMQHSILNPIGTHFNNEDMLSGDRLDTGQIEELENTGKYSQFIKYNNGGFLAVEKSNATHSEDELYAGRMMASKGMQIVMKDESGRLKTVDGLSVAIGTFDQRTPDLSLEQRLNIQVSQVP